MGRTRVHALGVIPLGAQPHEIVQLLCCQREHGGRGLRLAVSSLAWGQPQPPPQGHPRLKLQA